MTDVFWKHNYCVMHMLLHIVYCANHIMLCGPYKAFYYCSFTNIYLDLYTYPQALEDGNLSLLQDIRSKLDQVSFVIQLRIPTHSYTISQVFSLH